MSNISNTVKEAIRFNAITCEPIARNEDGTFSICVRDILNHHDMARITNHLSVLRAFGKLEAIDDPENEWIIKIKVI